MFRELGVSDFGVGFVWIAGPVSGLLVQPIVGVVSDHFESRYGRRRPFIVIGTLLVGALCCCLCGELMCVVLVLGLMMVSNAEDIGIALGDDPDVKPKSKAIPIAVSGVICIVW